MKQSLMMLLKNSVEMNNTLVQLGKRNFEAARELRDIMLRNGVSFASIDEEGVIKIIAPENIYIEPMEEDHGHS